MLPVAIVIIVLALALVGRMTWRDAVLVLVVLLVVLLLLGMLR